MERLTTPVRIAAALREQIAKGALPPGTRLHEVEFTAAFGVSRHTLREAITLLVGEGLLTRVSFKGVEVTRLSAEDVRDIYAARRLIELPAVEALRDAPPERLSALLAKIDDLVALPATVDSQTMNQADVAVHLALVAVHGSNRISAAYAALIAEQHILLFSGYNADDVAATIENHAVFGSLLRKGDDLAARVQLERRLKRAEDELVRACRPLIER
ncbi:MAG TPA: GntR family transcriptional regulator [Lichenihabitans sp.]|nr:GntR family transcriptional regulator [Lichenihabitans sp.]